MILVVASAAAEMVVLAAASGWTPGSAIHQLGGPTVASAQSQSVGCAQAKGSRPAPCASPNVPAAAGAAANARVIVPSGAQQCPSSGSGASCGNRKPVAERGTALLPKNLSACPTDAGKPDLGVPGACVAPSAGATAAPGAPAPPGGAARPTIALTADKTLLAYGSAATLAAVSSVNVSGTPYAIEIFDVTTSDLVGACMQGSTCLVSYAGKAGTHVFAAYLANPTVSLPASDFAAESEIQLQWLGVGLTSGNPAIVPPGQPITFTAYASVNVGALGYVIQFRDAVTGRVLTYCAQGTTCSTAVIRPSGGSYAVVASLVPGGRAHAAGTVTTTSGPIAGVWLGVQLTAGSVTSSGGAAPLTAQANADLSHSPWSIYIFSSTGAPVGHPCHAATCAASVAYSAGDTATYTAMIARPTSAHPATGSSGQNPGAASRADLQVVAQSAAARPVRVIWGVDSCQPSTMDPTGSTGLYPQVVSAFHGAPDFWGRYLTTTYNCPGLSPAEITSARGHHMGLLPIYNDYDCSNYAGYATGMRYAQAAVAAAHGLGIPAGTGIAVDIEPPGGACPGAWFVDASFLEAWYDGITQAHYFPIYYGDTTAGSAFSKGWCGAVASHPEYANTAYLWSFEPSLIGSWSKATAPGFAPNAVGCGGDHSAWQYSLSAGSTPNVDTDEALSRLPLWFP